jgi:folate-dependent phosphoribosylglycinamide formyltransferase PurN
MRIAVLCSHRAPGLAHLLDADPNHGMLYQIVCCLTSEEVCAETALGASRGIPVVVHPIRRFCRERDGRLSDLRLREAYDAATVGHLAPYRPDLVVLAGYLYLVTTPMLKAFRNRIINAHHGDLSRRDPAGRARFVGLRAVRDAIVAGEAETRATVHLVTSELDQGPPIVRSGAFPVSRLAHVAIQWGATDVLKAYVFAHQEWLIRSAFGPLLAAALESIATARCDLAALAAAHACLVEPGVAVGSR